MSKSCSCCYYGDKCHQREVCEYYHPIDPLAEDDAIDEMIEDNRIEFLFWWLEYTDEDAD